MKATLRLLITTAVLMTAQMSFAADSGSVKPGCPFAHVSGGLVKTNFEPSAPRTAPAAQPSTQSAS